MATSVTNLTNCDLEPIHIPGKIQSHGFLLVVDNNCIIRFISANASRFIGEEYTSLLDKPLQDFEKLLVIDWIPGFLNNLLVGADKKSISFTNINPLKITINKTLYNLILSTSHEYTLLEIEPISDFTEGGTQQLINQSIPGILGGKDLNEILAYAAVQVKSIIAYDRVMIYRFAPDGHGEVVAEAKNDGLDPLLGLHYPASDIPKQARELYKINITRLIADVYAGDADIITTDPKNVLDLTFSQLRAVSPVHIQYLKNMGVASSYSISLLYKNELWGLIACHNYTPRFIDYENRDASKLVGQILSAALELKQDMERLELQTFFQRNIDMLVKHLNTNERVEDALTRHDITLLDMLYCSGAVLQYNNKYTAIGKTPDELQISALARWINDNRSQGIFYTASLSEEYPPARAYEKIAAGIMAIPLSKEFNEYIIWFKEEIVQQVKWAGDPAKPVTLSADGMMNISPRHSFAVWIKNESGKSAPWMPEEIKAVLRFKEEMLTIISTRASATRMLNERLQLAYEELDAFSYTVSHDLNIPLAAIKGYAQVLSYDQSVSAEGKQLLQRISERTDKMNFMIKSVLDYSRIGRLPKELHIIDTGKLVSEVLEDLKQLYPMSGFRITVGDMPALRGDPVMIWQVFSNIIGNAVKYSQGSDNPAIHIEGWTLEKQVFYKFKDNGIGIEQKDLDNIFMLFSRMSNVAEIEGSGVGLAIVKRIVEKHRGIIWAESEPGNGSTFFLSFNVG